MIEKCIWAKKKEDESGCYWLSLEQHLLDCRCVIKYLFNHWLGGGLVDTISTTLSTKRPEDAEKLAEFLALIHDLGKVSPVFQIKSKYSKRNDLDWQLLSNLEKSGFLSLSSVNLDSSPITQHQVISDFLLGEYGVKEDIRSIISSHHGKPLDKKPGQILKDAYSKSLFQSEDCLEDIYIRWENTQRDFFKWALEKSGYDSVNNLPEVSKVGQVLLSGLLIMADWIASNEHYFPLTKINDRHVVNQEERCKKGIEKWHKSYIWEPEKIEIDKLNFSERFNLGQDAKMNPFQKKCIELVHNAQIPGLFIFELPMGYGKTEAALLSAEILAHKTKRNGIFFGLPTQATSDSMFERIVSWTDYLGRIDCEKKALRLMHGKAYLNETFSNLSTDINYEDESYAYVNQWFSGRKSSILADFVVGTVDHFLLGSLKQKHLSLRHLGLSKKVVIIDEVHAYDAYMNEYLKQSIKWMAAYGVPVIILSATLPKKIRKSLVEAYLLGKKAKLPETYCESSKYPLITYTDGSSIYQEDEFNFQLNKKEPSNQKLAKTVYFEKISEQKVIDYAANSCASGAIVGIIVNSIEKSQKLAKELADICGEESVELFHSAFIDAKRKEKEKSLIMSIGRNGNRPKRKIIIGTQVLEQSLDIDFDVLYTELSPIDLLIQRVGRLHRHSLKNRIVQKPICYIFGCSDEFEFDNVSKYIYKPYILMRTQSVLPDKLTIPDDISSLVEAVYDDEFQCYSNDCEMYKVAKETFLNDVNSKRNKAKGFIIGNPSSKTDINLYRWLTNAAPEDYDESALASVRDGEDKVEVIVVKECKGGYALLSEPDKDISSTISNPNVAKLVACQTIRLPYIRNLNIDGVIKELENYNTKKLLNWQNSQFLKGALGIILDSENKFTLGKDILYYSEMYGLIKGKDENCV